MYFMCEEVHARKFMGLINNNLLFRQELLIAREKQKEEQVETLKLSMQSGMVSFYSLL